LSPNSKQNNFTFDQLGKPLQPIPLYFDLVKIMNFVVVDFPLKKVQKNYDASQKWFDEVLVSMKCVICEAIIGVGKHIIQA